MNFLENYIEERKVEANFADRLRALDGSDSSAIASLISRLSPSANTLRGLLRLGEEIAKRDSSSLGKVLSRAPIKTLLENEKLGRKELQSRLVSALEEMRYPERAELQSKINQNVKALVKRYGVSFSVPDELEGDTLVVSIKARSTQELAQKISGLKQIEDDPSCEQIFRILLGES